MEITVTVNGRDFIADIAESSTGNAFIEMLPLSFEMEDLNGNEKCRYISRKLPAAAEPVGKIEPGDIMLFGSSCIVLFYDSLTAEHSYTRIGKIRDVEGLKAAAGRWDAAVSFRQR